MKVFAKDGKKSPPGILAGDLQSVLVASGRSNVVKHKVRDECNELMATLFNYTIDIFCMLGSHVNSNEDIVLHNTHVSY